MMGDLVIKSYFVNVLLKELKKK